MRREDVENWKGIQLKERAKNGKIRRDLRHWVLRWAYRYPEVMGQSGGSTATAGSAGRSCAWKSLRA
jgi:hypothetical protein